MLRVSCPDGHRLVVRDEHAGKLVRCPRCKAVVRAGQAAAGDSGQTPQAVVAPDSPTSRFLCPEGHPFRAELQHAGHTVSCPTCRVHVRLPQPAAARRSRDRRQASGALLAPQTSEPILPIALLLGTTAAVLLGITLWLRFSQPH